MKKARKALDRDNLTPEERKAYDYMQDQRSRDRSAIASTRFEGWMEGEIIGREEGRIERERIAKELEKEREEREEKERLAAEEKEILLAEVARLKQNEQKSI
jgi:hypothetical protein